MPSSISSTLAAGDSSPIAISSQRRDKFELGIGKEPMKVFVATEPTHEDRDFSFTIPGELVHLPPLICDCPDCGCDRAMAGFVSHKATTSFVVRDLDLDTNTYSDLLFETLKAGGWVSEESSADAAWVRSWAEEHIEIAAHFAPEVPLQVDGDRVTMRPTNRR